MATTENKARIHTVYKLQDGTRVPSVTTVLSILDKPALLSWAWQCGIDGIDYRKARDGAAGIGTLAHYLIMCVIKGQTPDTSEYSAADIDQAETCLIKYFEWAETNKLTAWLVETQRVSELFRFGGTIDFVGLTPDNKLWLVDNKTGKGIYPEMVYQLAGYRQLLREAGAEIDSARILRIGRNPDEGFEERIFTPAQLDTGWEIFQHCLGIYNLRGGLK